jgi:tetratricopeptide (TPR) repeat protein
MNNPLFASLGLLAIWQYLSWIETKRRSHWIIGTLALILAMFAKPTAVVIPPMALVLDWAINRRDTKVALRSIAPWFALIVPCVIWTKLAQHGSIAGAQAPIWFRPFIAGDVAAFYLIKLVAPFHLAIDYGRNPAFLYANAMTYIAWLLPVAMIAAAITVRRRYPLIAAGIAIFLIALLPNSGLIAFDYEAVSAAADRYAYLALGGIALIVAALCTRLSPRMIAIAGVVVFITLSVATVRQIQVWQNGETLFRHALAINPRSWIAWNNYANVIADHSPDEAIDACRRAIAIKPDYASAYNNLGSLLMDRGDRAAALAAFEAAHRYDPEDPTFAANVARARDTSRP